MIEDRLVDVVAHVGLDHLCRDGAVVGHRDGLADVVHERTEDHLVVSACLFRHRRRLQAVGELVGDEAVADLGERLEQHDHPVGDPTLVLEGPSADVGPLLGSGLVHAAETVGIRIGDGHAVMVLPL